jgi:hypothetical protein
MTKRHAHGSKRESQLHHAQNRGWERYGLPLDAAGLDKVVRQIQSGQATFVGRESLRVSIFDVAMEGGTVCRVVYDRHRKSVVTFLPVADKAGDVPWRHYRG